MGQRGAGGIKVTVTVAKVLRLFLDDPVAPRYGFDLMQAVGLPSGTLYPILARLESAGWISGEREELDPSEAKRPARRMYTLTAHGATAARRELATLSAQLQPPDALRVLRPGRAGHEGLPGLRLGDGGGDWHHGALRHGQR